MRMDHDRSADSSRSAGRGRLARFLTIVLAAIGVMAGECDPKGPGFFDPVDSSPLPAVGDLLGRVTVDGESRAGVAVTLSRGGETVGTVTTVADGGYVFFDLEAGTYTVSISSVPDAQCPGPKTAVVPPDGDVEVDFECVGIPTTGTVIGTVVDEDGNGIEGAAVALNGRTETTDASGAFEFDEVEPGSYTVQATASGLECDPQTTMVTAGRTSTVEIPCSAPPADFGVTVDGGFDHPPGGQSFVCGKISTDPAQAGAAFEVEVSGPAVDGDGRQTGTLDAGGMARFTQLISDVGTYTIRVTVTVDGVAKTATTTVNVTGTGGSCP